MSEETAIEILDFSQPPPGHSDCAICESEADGPGRAWAHHRARHDPPGFRVSLWESWSPAPAAISFFAWEFETPGLIVKSEKFGDLAEARAAAWDWYERRLALALRFDLGDEGGARVNPVLQDVVEAPGWSTWLRILTWTDEQVAEVERWLVDRTAEMPEVLRG